MVISTRSKKKVYHWDFCPYAKRVDGRYKKILSPKQAKDRGYTECSWCGKTHGLYLRLKNYPEAFPKELSKMNVSYDKEYGGICFKTSLGFWKIIWDHGDSGYRLYHLNERNFDLNEADKSLMLKKFHRQKDVDTTKHVGKIICYIHNHDKAKRIMDEDWRKLPRQTQLQKDYYNKKKKKERKKSIRRVHQIFKELEKERTIKHG